ncbi:MAG: sulfotransferase family protein [Pseudomonadota bacterium]
MGYPGVWMTQSQNMIYRVVPKCACSTIGQIMYYGDHGSFFDGDIHDATEGLHKWALHDSRDAITHAVHHKLGHTFTCVRNPYSRILSAFFDKICGIQRNGQRYRGNLVPTLVQTYGIEVEGDFDQVASFRRFLLFARDTIKYKDPMDPDLHWSSMSGHISTLIANGGKYDQIFHTENFRGGMQDVLNHVDINHAINLDDVPRFNESAEHGPKMAHPVADYFDDLSRHLVYEIYKKDFDLFKYDAADPSRKKPIGEIDLDEVHAVLAD